MCKYCDIGNDKINGETLKLNDTMEIQEGKLLFNLLLYRAMYDDGDENKSANLCMLFGMTDGTPIDEKTISIKYCPFCGEEL